MISTTSRSAVILLGISGQIILTALFLWRFEPTVENELTRASELALQEASLPWARVVAHGRDLTLSGMAPSVILKNQAVSVVEQVDGVRKVNDNLLVTQSPSVVPPQSNELDAAEVERRAREMLADIEDSAPIFATELPYELRLQVAAGVLTLSGIVPDAIGKESLLNLANREFGEGRLIDRLIVSPGAPDAYLTAATRAIEAAAILAEGFVGVTDTEVVVEGVTADTQGASQLAALLDDGLPESYTSRIQIGDRKALTQILRTYPELADRVGPLEQTGLDSTIIETKAVPRPSPRSSAPTIPAGNAMLSHSRCQQVFNELLRNRRIGFTTASSQIDGASLGLLADLVTAAKRCPDTRIEIQGHTDDQGTSQNNLRLSQRRAEAVMEYLVRNGVSLRRLSAVGFGEEQPLVQNTSAAQRKLNRRIEFKIIDES